MKYLSNESQLCVDILLKSISKSHVQFYNLFLLIISTAFLCFLTFQCRKIFRRLLSNHGIIINFLFVLLCLNCALKVLRAVVAIVSANGEVSKIVDKSLWLIIRFILLSIEMSILTFGIATAKLDSKKSIQRVLIVASLISFTYTTIQATLEFSTPDFRFALKSQNYTVYSHGGSVFSFSSSLLLAMVYLAILVLPCVPACRRLRLPTKRIFYAYCIVLASLYIAEAIGNILFFAMVKEGLCVIDATTFLYFAFYDGLVYIVFMHAYFGHQRSLSFRHDQYVIEYSDNSGSHSSTVMSNYRPSSVSVSGDNLDDDDNQERHFYPDNCVVLDRSRSMADTMKGLWMLPEGVRIEYEERPPSTMSSDAPNGDDKSAIISLSYDAASTTKHSIIN